MPIEPTTNSNTAHTTGDELMIECILIGGLLPFMTILYRGRRIQAYFARNLWENHTAILDLAIEIVEARHSIHPFN